MTESIVIPRYCALSKDCSLFKSPIKSKPKSFYRNKNKVCVLKLDKPSEPARLESVFEELVLNVITESIKKSEIVASLPFVYENLNRFKIAFGTELTELLISHKQLENAFEATYGVGSSRNISTGFEVGSVNELRHLSRLSSLKRSNSEISLPSMSSTSPMSVEETEDAPPFSSVFESLDPVAPFSSRTYIIKNVTPAKDVFEVCPRTSSASKGGRRKLLPLKEVKISEQEVVASASKLLKTFLANPTAYQAVMADKSYQPDEQAMLTVNLLKQKKTEIERRLKMSPDELAMLKHEVRIAEEEQRVQEETMQRHNSEIQAIQQQKFDKVAKLDEEIEELKSTIENLELMSEDSVMRVESSADKKILSDQKNHNGKMLKLNEQLQQAEYEYEQTLASNWEQEAALRAQHLQIENKIEAIIETYDKEMTEKQNEIDKIEIVYAEEQVILAELMERFEVVKAEYLTIMEERRQIREAREAAERELQMCIRAASTIQSIWRAFKVRKAVKARKRRSGRGNKKIQRKSVAQ